MGRFCSRPPSLSDTRHSGQRPAAQPQHLRPPRPSTGLRRAPHRSLLQAPVPGRPPPLSFSPSSLFLAPLWGKQQLSSWLPPYARHRCMLERVDLVRSSLSFIQIFSSRAQTDACGTKREFSWHGQICKTLSRYSFRCATVTRSALALLDSFAAERVGLP